MNKFSELFSTLKNAINARLKIVIVRKSKIIIEILKLLEIEGFIDTFTIIEADKIVISLKYINGKPMFTEIKRLSYTRKRYYVTHKQFVKNSNKRELLILTTSHKTKGGSGIILSSKIPTFSEKRSRNKFGGELLGQIILI